MNLNEMLEKFQDDVVWIFYIIQEYRIVFIDNDNNSLMVNTAANFFDNYKRLFWNNLIISISRLIDPFMQGSNENLTIDVMTKFAEENKLQCIDSIQNSISTIRKESNKIKTWRHKILAHRDIQYALKNDFADLKIHLDEIEIIMTSIANCLNSINKEANNLSISWSIVTSHGAGSLLYYLNEGLVYSNLKRDRNNWQLDIEEKNKYKIVNNR